MNNGYLIILAGYIGWGLFPLYWSLLTHVGPLEVLTHRVIWSVPVLILFVWAVQRWRTGFKAAIKSRDDLKVLVFSAFFITVNWGVYIWAVTNGRVVEASMGYFLTPLLHITAGLIIFKEKLSRYKKAAVLIAALGVAYYIYSASLFPWVGLVLGFSFASYGILRKVVTTTAVPGLLIETLMIAPVFIVYMTWLHTHGQAEFLHVSRSTDFYLVLGGLVTVVPLALFTTGARLLPMATTGILFYITPSLQFITGYFLFGEALNLHELIGFGFIWFALLIYAYALTIES